MTSRGLRRAFAVSALAILPLLEGCVLALGGQGHVSGDNLPHRLPELEPGVPKEQVLTQLGAPLSAPSPGSDDRLRWSEVIRPRGCRMYLFGLIPLNRSPRATRQVEADFEGGRLIRADVTYLDRRGRVARSQSLLRDGSTPSATAPTP